MNKFLQIASNNFDSFFSAQSFGDYGFRGKVSYVRIWQNRALSAAEANQLYQAPFAMVRKNSPMFAIIANPSATTNSNFFMFM